MVDSSKEELSFEQRQQIFKEELALLRDKKLIPKTDYIRMSNAYERHVQQTEKSQLLSEAEERKQAVYTDLMDNVPESEIDVPLKIRMESEELISSEKKQTVVKKVEKTAEQLRERNISIVLITGVILLLFGGLIWATSTWGNLNAVLKVGCISLVSIFFAGNAFIAFKLNIKQTAFAFLTLASLFIPISILSASYYHIFGEYLSLQGEGRGLLGLIGGLICLVIYFKIADYFQSKLFIFISFVTFTVTAFFGMAYLTYTNEVLFLLMTIFNLFFLLNLEKVKNVKKLVLFKPYGFQFIMFKIIVEAFVMLTLFLSTMVYSITLLITSVLFFILAFRYKKTYFHFVFSILFTYGYIHLVSNSFLDEIAVIAFAILPLIFTSLFTYLQKKDQTLSKAFMYTSLVASSFVLLYIYGVFFSEQETQRFLALLILAAQFVYLALEEKGKDFTYPAFILFNLAFVHLGFAFGLDHSAVLNLLFVIQLILYVGVYVYNHHQRWSLFRESALYISSFVMVSITFLKFVGLHWLAVSVCLAAISGLFLLTYYQDRSSKWLTKISTYGFPISLTLALLALYPTFNERYDYIDVSVHLLIVALLMISFGFVWKGKEVAFFHVFFITGQSVSLLAFVFLYDSSLHALVITILMLIITSVNGLSVYVYHKHWLWLAVLVTSVGVYGSLFAVFDVNSDFFDTAFYLMGPLLFLLIGEWIGTYSVNGERYYFWYSQLMNVVAIPVGYLLLVFEEVSPWLYGLVILLYVITALRTKVYWQKALFTYMGCIALYAQVLLVCTEVFSIEYTASFTFMLTAGIILVLWGLANQTWKRIIDYYLIPFLHLAIGVHLIEVFVDDFPTKMELAWVGGTTILLGCTGYLLIRKNWQQVMVVPLLFTLLYFTTYSETLLLLQAILVLFGWLIVMLFLSKQYSQGLIIRTESGIISGLDYYRIFGLFFLLVMNGRVFANETKELVLEIIVSCLVVVYFLVIRSWTINDKERKLYVAAAVTVSLYPYQVILQQLKISDLLVAEINIFPFFFIGPFLLRKIINRGKQTQIIEIIFVSCLFGILLFDALAGNTLNDALIIGTISLVAVILGFIMKYKSFFLAGTGTILVNVYMNTNSLWGQMPWWIYLIIGGIVLIAAASFLEWKKQKNNTTSKELVDRNKQRLKNWFNKWN